MKSIELRFSEDCFIDIRREYCDDIEKALQIPKDKENVRIFADFPDTKDKTTYQPHTHYSVDICIGSGETPERNQVLLGVDIGADGDDRFSDEGYAVLDSLLDRIPYDSIRDTTLAFMEKYDLGKDEFASEEDVFFCGIDKTDVTLGHYNPIGLIAENEMLYPFASVVYYPDKDEMSMFVGMSDGTGRELVYDVPLTVSEKNMLRCVLDNRIDTEYLRRLSGYKEKHKEIEKC